MIRDYHHIALIRNAPGRVVGMITLEDILEELVGDIGDEYDRLPHHAMPSGPAWVAGGGITVAKLREATGFDLSGGLPSLDGKTLDDWIRGHLGGGVEGGEILERDGFRVVIRKVRRRMVLEAQVARSLGGSDSGGSGRGSVAA
jgi:putative hemolysin